MNPICKSVLLITIVGSSACSMQPAQPPPPAPACDVTNPNVIEVKLPPGLGRPTVDYERACFEKHENPKVAFEVPLKGIGLVYVIFKDKTPIVDQSGNRLYVLRGPQAINGKKFDLHPNVQVGDYHYMLVDTKNPNRQVNDPVIVIQP